MFYRMFALVETTNFAFSHNYGENWKVSMSQVSVIIDLLSIPS